jgi:hypothetical protein
MKKKQDINITSLKGDSACETYPHNSRSLFSTGDIRPEASCEEIAGSVVHTLGEVEDGTRAVIAGNLSTEVDRDRDGIVDKVESEPPTPVTSSQRGAIASGGEPAVGAQHQPHLSIATFDEWTKEKLMRGQHFQVRPGVGNMRSDYRPRLKTPH